MKLVPPLVYNLLHMNFIIIKRETMNFVMEYKFSNRRRQRSKELITIVGERVAQRDHFCLIGNNGERGRRGASN